MKQLSIVEIIRSRLRDLGAAGRVFSSQPDLNSGLSADLSIPARVSTRGLYGGSHGLIFSHPTGEAVVHTIYRTRPGSGRNLESLRHHGAQDQARAMFWKNVSVGEGLIAKGTASAALSLLLTNDPLFWEEPRRIDVIDYAFRLHQGRSVEGDLRWSESASAGSKKGIDVVMLHGSYRCDWEDYLTINESTGGRFRYLLLPARHEGHEERTGSAPAGEPTPRDPPTVETAEFERRHEYEERLRSRRESLFFVRNGSLARHAKRTHGYKCMVCGFDFGDAYGELGAGFIECHHLNPLAERERTDSRTTVEDVAVVCANCHRMIHRVSPALSLAELKRRLGTDGS